MRSRIGTMAAVIHTLYTGMLVVASIYLFWQARQHAISLLPDSARHSHAMWLGGCVIGIACVLYATCSVGLWRNRAWARWLSVVVNAIGVAALMSDFFGDYEPDGEDWLAVFLFVAPLLLSLWNALQRPSRGKETIANDQARSVTSPSSA